MINKSFSVISTFLFSAIALFTGKVEASQAKGLYLNSAIGLSNINSLEIEGFTSDLKFEPRLGGHIGLGYDFDSFRTEINYKHNQSELLEIGGSKVSTDIKFSSVMANIYYDFTNYSKFITSIGLGIGNTNIDIENISGGGDSEVTTYNAQLQIGYLLTPKTEVYIEGFYDFYNDFQINNVDFSDINGYCFVVGSRFKF